MITAVVPRHRPVARRRLRVAALAMATLAVWMIAAPAQAAVTRILFAIADTRIDEASGIAAGMASPGILYVENDSGDTNRFFALDRATGATAAVVTVPGATNVDWEDIAVSRDSAGTPSVWLADIGDNSASRSEVDVYRIDEPAISTTDRNRAITSARPDVWRLSYPGGPVNAESLAVTPNGRAYIVTKSLLGASQVYRLPLDPDPTQVRTPADVGAIQFTATRSGGVASVTATSAGFNRSGDLFVVRTYTNAYVWQVNGYLAPALTTPATRITLPSQPQGEGVVIQGDHLLLDSERVHSDVWRVQLPASLTAAVVRDNERRRAASRSVVARVSGLGVGGLPGVGDVPDEIIGAFAGAAVALALALANAARRRRGVAARVDARRG